MFASELMNFSAAFPTMENSVPFVLSCLGAEFGTFPFIYFDAQADGIEQKRAFVGTNPHVQTQKYLDGVFARISNLGRDPAQ